ncbi:MAG: 2-amino-4-hydroxy-6-hydroxymethyldihydropteridine diphosphokinase [Actinobacteria bacterium]|nr:2-amino-4-hydroxy-6-hydroxymethyldihydropteridine diphosphokinase [Actinomycetota bacterium]MCB9389755.1 2-amino-4-hydroxy-6-hydroxymethyldihydropteridine diphosphokinase [Acidimicrobiia bacterium]
MTGRRVAYLALGSNLGDRTAHLQRAINGLGRHSDVDVVASSKVYETDPIGPDQPDFLNAVLEVQTSLDALSLLRACQEQEDLAGRVRAERWGPRTLDVDVLYLGDERIDTPELVIPHPRIEERGFVLAPLRDVAPHLVQNRGNWPGVRPTDISLVVGAKVGPTR